MPTCLWDLPVLVFEVSNHASVPRLRRTERRLANSDDARAAFHRLDGVGIRIDRVFGARKLRLVVPLPIPHPTCYHDQRTTQGQRSWLGFHCKTLSFSTSNRFIPAFSKPSGLSTTADGSRRTATYTSPAPTSTLTRPSRTRLRTPSRSGRRLTL